MNLGKRLRERRAAAERVEEIRERILRLREGMTRITPRYDAEGGGSGAEDRMMAYAARLDQLERELTRASRRAYRISLMALEAVEQLPEAEAAVIICREFLGMSWSRTARETQMNVMACRRAYKRALGIGQKQPKTTENNRKQPKTTELK